MASGSLIFLVVVVMFAAMIAYGIISYQRKKARSGAIEWWAAANGYRYYGDSIPGHFPNRRSFDMLHQGDGQRFENMLERVNTDGSIEWICDFSYYEESTDSEGHTSRSWTHQLLAGSHRDRSWPHCTIGRETFFSRVAGRMGFRGVTFESEEFNEMFRVKCDEPKFASDLIDPRMMEMLMGLASDVVYEVGGSVVLVARDANKDAAPDSTLGLVHRFEQQVPRVVADLWPGPGGSPR